MTTADPRAVLIAWDNAVLAHRVAKRVLSGETHNDLSATEAIGWEAESALYLSSVGLISPLAVSRGH